MKTLNEFLVTISNDELSAAISEIHESEKLGFIKEDGLIRKYTKINTSYLGIIGDINSTPLLSLINTQIALMKEAANRWHNIVNPPKEKSKTKEERFHEIVTSNVAKPFILNRFKEHRNLNWFKGGEPLFIYDSNEDKVQISYKHIWSVFEKEYKMIYPDIYFFMKEMMEKYYGLGYLKPQIYHGNISE